jgi:3-mercaptopyruvate sulfurtransferase SseA
LSLRESNAAAPFGPLVSADWLGEKLADTGVGVIDLRWYLDPPEAGTREAALPPESLRLRFERLGVGEGPSAVVYCGSGISAGHDLLALEIAGLEGARLYPGSWSDWCARPGAEVATTSR